MSCHDFLTSLFRAAIQAVDPERLTREALGRRGDALYVRSISDPHGREFIFVPERVYLLSLGKAAVPMARAALDHLGSLVHDALVIAPAGAPTDGLPAGCRVMEGSHPHPDERSLAAGEAAIQMAHAVRTEDVFLVLASGGGSSLAAATAGSLTLEEKSRTIALLMAAGAPIADINLVRGALSRLKAGRLANAVGSANVVTLVISDVGDNGFHLVASGPSLGIPPSPREAMTILERYRVAPLVPSAVRHFLTTAPPCPPVSHARSWSVLLADIRTALEGARQEALRLGTEPRVVPELLTGEARSAARRLAVAGARAGNLLRRSGPRQYVTLFGGETTVTVKGPGKGGRSRELALATALQIRGVAGAAALVAGTDGVDNEPDAAGAFVDSTTIDRAVALGLDPMQSLLDNDTGPFFAKLEDAFSPGPTGTNVGDVAFVLSAGPENGTAAPPG